jgi:hypothetical protein
MSPPRFEKRYDLANEAVRPFIGAWPIAAA